MENLIMADDITYKVSQQSVWTLGQTVNVSQMNDFTQDIYSKFQALTGLNACILYLSGSITDNGNGSITIPSGSFRFNITSYDEIPFTTAIYGNVENDTTISVTGDGYIVARYSITPTNTGANEYFFPTTYQFVTSIDNTTDCLICEISGGSLSTTIGDFYLANLHNNTNLTNLNVISYNITNRNYYGQFKLGYYDVNDGYFNKLLLVASNGQVELTTISSSLTSDWKLTKTNASYQGLQLNTTYNRPIITSNSTLYVGTGTWDPRVAALGDMRAINYSDTTNGIEIQGLAVYNGVHWQASISGYVLYGLGTLSTNPYNSWTYQINLTNLLGINTSIKTIYGVAQYMHNYSQTGTFYSLNGVSYTTALNSSILLDISISSNLSITTYSDELVTFSTTLFFGAYS